MKLWKRTIAITMSLFFIAAVPTAAYALDETSITAPAAVLMEPETGRVLFEKNAHEVRACASITKVMTLLLVFEAIDSGKLSMDETVTASAHASSMGGSDIWLEEGETMTVDEMIKATVVASANDAAVALAEHICGTEEEFVSKMNQKAKELGMKETTFKNCNGLDEEGHLTSAYDVALMSRELIKHKDIFKYTGIWMDYLRDGKTQLVNTNKLLKSYNGITGLKTGTTGDAGSCITATATRGELSLIGVVLGSASGKERFTDAATILDYGFANYSMYSPKVPDEAITNISVVGGMQGSVKTAVSGTTPILIKKGEEKNISQNLNLPESVEAPVKKGDKIGSIEYTLDKKKIAESPVMADGDVQEMTFWSVFAVIFAGLLSI